MGPVKTSNLTINKRERIHGVCVCARLIFCLYVVGVTGRFLYTINMPFSPFLALALYLDISAISSSFFHMCKLYLNRVFGTVSCPNKNFSKLEWILVLININLHEYISDFNFNKVIIKL